MYKKNPSLLRVYGSLIYELFALLPIWMLASFIFIYFLDGFFGVHQTLFFQIYLWLTSGFYLTYCWVKSGQTLAMRAWNIRICSHQYRISINAAWIRYMLATIGCILGGVTFLWALTNKKNLYLHDQILNNYFIDTHFYKSSPSQLKRK